MNEENKAYNPKEVEGKIYKMWEDGKYFTPKTDSKKKPFTIVIPPPNVTGNLHMGHALNNTIQDVLIRRARMRGIPTLWLPGTDHAGIATQNVVEKMLAKEGKSRHELGREKFIETVWEWKEKYGHIIIDQLKQLGCSCDWTRERFTMDDEYAKAVDVAFSHYYKKGLIYKGKRVINWCVRCQTSLSDLEVEHNEQPAKLYYFKYDKNFPITIATTRPETKLGDTAVAVNPSDKRYKKYVGKTFKINFAGIEREIKIISDRAIDMKFGTGALGVTPAHSIIDSEMAEKNNLPSIQVIDQYGKMTKEAGKDYEGLKVKEAQEKIVSYLKENNLMEKPAHGGSASGGEEDITNNISVCYRCNRPIEPLPSEQWFLKMKELVKPAMKAIQKGEIKLTPSRWKKVYIDWMENIRDWCISRQIWWGHRIPIKGETDVLDTWFSAALWPFATLGWPLDFARGKPVKGSDLEYFYPTSILSTARDINMLWVVRMIFSGQEFMGKNPFSKVYIHPTVFNKEGKRMSKSLGTGIDPLELMDKYGTDATRFGLMYMNTGTQDIKFSEETILMGKKFANKIWNASRFVTSSITEPQEIANKETDIHAHTDADKTILKKMKETVKQVDKDLDGFKFGQAAHTLYEFFWHDFCDQYLEASKDQLKDEKLSENTQQILFYVLIVSLKMLHPFMPFLTEKIYQDYKEYFHDQKDEYFKPSIMISDWPDWIYKI